MIVPSVNDDNSNKNLICNLSKLAYKMAVVDKVSRKHISTITFDQLNDFLRETPTLDSTYQFLDQMLKCCLALNKAARPTFRQLNTRVFLVAYLATMHTTQVIEVMNEQAIAMVESGKNMLRQFNRITNVLLLNPNNSSEVKTFKVKQLKKLSKEFIDAISDYLPKFKEWKLIDEIRVKDLILVKFWRLFRAKLTYAGRNERFDLQDPIIIRADMQLNSLRQRLGKVCGKKTLDELDAQVAKELRHRRNLFLLREEHARRYGPASQEPIFDFIFS
jgi:hypothetical protein